MAKKMSGQNPVDEAYLRSLMAGSPPEKVTPSIPPKEETDGKRLKRQRRNLKRKRRRKRPHPKR